MREAGDDTLEGYLDGLDLTAPEPSDNRSHSYRHGFANARDDRRGKPRASAALLRQWLEEAEAKDRGVYDPRKLAEAILARGVTAC